jgi:hypothetical protein
MLLGSVGLATFSVIGLLAAMLGAFDPVPVVGLAVLVASAVAVLTWRELGAPPPAGRAARALAALVVVGAATWAVWNASHHAEHLIVDRDPGVYVATGAWLADEGDLEVTGRQGPFEGRDSLRPAGQGFSVDGHSLDPQFPHLTAVFLGAAAWFGDMRMFLVNPVLGAAGLVSLYALGTRLGGRVGAASGALLFSFVYPLLHFSRDTYSEPLSLLLLFSGLWLLSVAMERRGVALGVVSGVLLGATCMARIDGFVALIPVSAFCAVTTRLALRADDRRAASVTAGAGIATVAASTLGAVDTWLFSRSYFHSNLVPRLPWMVAAAIILSTVLWVAGPWLWSTEDGSDRPRGVTKAAALIGGAGLVLLFGWARFVRPDFDALRELMKQALLTGDLGPEAWPTAYLWLEWYLGPLITTVGLTSLLWLAWRGVQSPRHRIELAVSGAALVATVLYVVEPSITPDHPWAMRRFLSASLPAICLAAGVGLERFARVGSHRRLRAAVTTVAGAAGLWAIVTASSPFFSEAVGVPLAQRFNEICAVAAEEPSAILIAPDRLLGATAPQTLQVWCDVPVAGATDGTTAHEVHALDRAWAQEGRRLLILATSPNGIDGATGPGAQLPETVLRAPEHSVDRPPRELVADQRISQAPDGSLQLFILEVDPEYAAGGSDATHASRGLGSGGQ